MQSAKSKLWDTLQVTQFLQQSAKKVCGGGDIYSLREILRNI